MYNIFTLNKISPAGLDHFDKSQYTFVEAEQNPDAILVRSASMHDMELGSNLKAIARAGAGVNNIPIDRCTEQGVCVFNTPGANANAVKELVLLGLLLSSRKVAPAIEWVKQELSGKGDEVGKLVEKGKSSFAGPELKGKKLGVIGLGAIGVLVANAATHLGMTVYGYDPYISVNAAWNLSRNVMHATALKEIYEKCDYISVHVPCTSETKHMISAESIATMKTGVRIVNFARGELVNNADMMQALDDGKVACYVTDFPADELIGHKSVVCIPHLGASTPESEDNCAQMAALQVIDYLENGNIKNSVNLPNAEMPRSGKARICVIHKNVTGAISNLTTIVSDSGLNIDNLLNKSRKEYAYSMIDVETVPDDAVIEKLRAIDSVIALRILR